MSLYQILLISVSIVVSFASTRELQSYKAGQAGARTFNPDILEESNKCKTTCTSQNRGVCQAFSDSSTSYCCNDATDCKAYQDLIGDGLCSSTVTQSFAKQMACPYETDKCGSYQYKTKYDLQNAERNSEDITQQKVTILSDGKNSLLKQKQYLQQGDFCYYKVEVQSAPIDQFLSIELGISQSVSMNLIIALSLEDQYFDLCTDIKQGDLLFARYPFKFFPIFESQSSRGAFQADVKFQGKDMDLPLTKNRFKCKRVSNRLGGYNQKTGSTVGGNYGYGYATNAQNEAIGTTSPKAPISTGPVQTNEPKDVGGGGNSQDTQQDGRNQNMEPELFTVTNNLVFSPLRQGTVLFDSGKSLKKNIVSANYAWIIIAVLVFLTISLCIGNKINQNKVDSEVAKERVRSSNIDNLFREEEEKEDGDDSSSSSSSFQDSEEQRTQDARVSALNNAIQGRGRVQPAEDGEPDLARQRTREERKEQRRANRANRGEAAERPRRNAAGAPQRSQEREGGRDSFSPLDEQVTNQDLSDSRMEINNNFGIQSPQIAAVGKRNKVRPSQENQEPFADILDRDDIEDSIQMTHEPIPVVTREQGNRIRIGTLTSDN